jgi:DNA-binding SARP family transcriptional activator/tetratricopeptide (TPR) repeat protein
MDVSISLLGGFRVHVDGAAIPDDAWRRRGPAALVKLLALVPERRLHREQVVDALWPDAAVAEAGPRLHKAAHFARRALGEATSGVVLRGEMVLLLPEERVEVDVALFEDAARRALREGDAAAAAEVLDSWPGVLLPDDLYQPWAEQPRDRLSQLRADLLRRARRWEALLAEDPGDEEAHLGLARQLARDGDLRGALRQLERLDRALRAELGTAPGPDAVRLRASLQAALGREVAASAEPGAELVGRERQIEALDQAMTRARAGRGGAVLVTGPTGVGKSALIELAVHRAGEHGWRIGRGAASSLEGPWAYASVLEALADLCRRHPTLLDGLDDALRGEIDSALSGRTLEWSGESSHQRLFVAAAELLRLAGAGHGLLLVVEDLHEADDASLRLVHYLARCAVEAPILLLLSARASSGSALPPALASLLARGMGARIDLAPLSLDEAMDLLAERHPDLTRSAAERIWIVSGGLPFGLLEGARLAEATDGPGLPAPRHAGSVPVTGTLVGLAPSARVLVERLAVLGTDATSDEVVALADGDPDAAFADVEAATDALLLVPGEVGYRFRHEAVREAVLAATTPLRRTALHREVAQRLAGTGAPRAVVARHFIAGGDPASAVPHVMAAIDTLGALGAYRDAMELADAVLDHTRAEERGRLLARRGDLLMALGSPEAITCYRSAIPLVGGVDRRLARARLSRAACFAGDMQGAAAAIEGEELLGDAADGPLLLARGNLAFFARDMDAAWAAANAARREITGSGDAWQYLDLVSLQGFIAHDRGEWFDHLSTELRRTLGSPDLAANLFDAHLCVTEFLLYGPVPYPEVIDLATRLRDRAEQSGALRAVAFANALLGEAALLMGDLDVAQQELERSVELHRAVAAPAGEAHTLQRLAEVRLALGDRPGAQRLLQRALPLARWSLISLHLLQRIYGTMIQAAADPVAARAVVDQADATLGETDRCAFCDIMLAVPAAIACARVGDLHEARCRLADAEIVAERWGSDALRASVVEARAHVAVAEGDGDTGGQLFAQAAEMFQASGQVLDAGRCRDARLLASA